MGSSIMETIRFRLRLKGDRPVARTLTGKWGFPTGLFLRLAKRTLKAPVGGNLCAAWH
jgi:hypothetical protein